MTSREGKMMNDLELQLLWNGVESFTGLWQAAVLARDNGGGLPGATSRERAERTLVSLVEKKFIVVYECRGIPNDETCDRVQLERLTELLAIDASWEAPQDEDGLGVWFDTTDEGFAVYRQESGWRDS